MIRVLLLSDRALCCAGLRTMLATSAEPISVIGEAQTPDEMLDKHGRELSAVVLVDMAGPIAERLEVTRQLANADNNWRIILLGSHGDDASARRAIEAGADGFLWNGADITQLVEAVRTVQRGETFISPQVALPAQNGSRVEQLPAAVLSKREFEVLCSLARGMTNREIASELGISVKTIDTHRGHVLKKLQLRNNSDLTRFAIRHGFVDSSC